MGQARVGVGVGGVGMGVGEAWAGLAARLLSD